MAYSPRDL